MFKLITYHLNTKYEFETETLDEALSLAIDAFNNHHELQEIRKDDICIFLYCELYEAIGKRVY